MDGVYTDDMVNCLRREMINLGLLMCNPQEK